MIEALAGVGQNKPMMNTFPIPADTLQTEQVIKNSRFITYLGHAADPEAAHRFIADIRARYPDARHVCWAFIAGQPRHTTDVGCSDDGEPSGTAGKPMLNVLHHGETGEIVAVVVRYFGGIKLGTGGLARAYSSSVSATLKLLPTRLKVAMQALHLSAPYPQEDGVRRLLAALGVVIDAAEYGDYLQLNCRCPLDRLDALQTGLADQGRGQISLRLIL